MYGIFIFWDLSFEVFVVGNFICLNNAFFRTLAEHHFLLGLVVIARINYFDLYLVSFVLRNRKTGRSDLLGTNIHHIAAFHVLPHHWVIAALLKIKCCLVHWVESLLLIQFEHMIVGFVRSVFGVHHLAWRPSRYHRQVFRKLLLLIRYVQGLQSHL